MSNALKEIEDFKKSLIRRLLDQCTEPQIELFNRIFPDIEKIPADKIESAILLCERTVIKNQKP